MTTINHALRDHVTSARFVLSLGSTHIAALVWLDWELRRNRSMDEDLRDRTLRDHYPAEGHPLRRPFRHNVTGAHGLEARGLVTHTTPTPRNGRRDINDYRPDEIWTITPAGRAVIALLIEAGIWQEYSGAIPTVEESTVPRDRRAA